MVVWLKKVCGNFVFFYSPMYHTAHVYKVYAVHVCCTMLHCMHGIFL